MTLSCFRHNIILLYLLHFLLIVILLLMALGTQGVHGNIENYCFGVPSGSTKTEDFQTIGYKSINQPQWFGIAHSYSLKTTTRFEFQVEVYGIKFNGVPLQGWFHVIISVSNEAAFPQRFVINARGYTSKGYTGNNPGWVSGIGEFSSRFPSCDDFKEVSEESNSDQFLPCGGIPPFEPTVGYGFAAKANSKHKVHLNFRFSQMPFNFYSKINFRVHGFQNRFEGDKYSYNTVANAQTLTIQMNPFYLMGASDGIPVKHPNSKLTCHEPLSPDDYPYILTNITESLGPSKCYEDYSCLPAKGSDSFFAGRCLNRHSPQGQTTSRLDGTVYNVHVFPDSTDLDPTFLASLGDFQDEIDKIVEIKTARCSSTKEEDNKECPTLPPRPGRYDPITHETIVPFQSGRSGIEGAPVGRTVKVVKAPPISAALKATEKTKIGHGPSLVKMLTMPVWDARVAHGVLMTILTMFITPVDAIITRYFKETWMGKTILMNNYWFFFHHLSTALSFMLYTAGMIRLLLTKSYLGTSIKTSRIAHASLGYTSMCLFLFMMVFGGLRCYKRSYRAITIALHFCLGLLIYLLNLTAIVLSTLIPASPSSAGSSWKFQFILTLLLLRIVLDISTHVFLSIQLCKSDRKLKLDRRRFYLPVPIPVLENTDFVDAPGSILRIKTLQAFVILSLLLTIGMCIAVTIADIETIPGFGPMSCTHESEIKLVDKPNFPC